MTDSPILLLDVMSTLVTEPWYEDVPAFFGLDLEALYQVKDQDAWIEFEKGLISEEEYCARFFKDGRPIDIQGFKAMMKRSYQWMNGVEPLLQELRDAGHRMYALSNYSPWYALIEEKLGLSRYLGWDFVSCKTGVRKPDPEAYLGPVRSLGVTPDRCIFVDDRQKNVDAARAVGMQGILRTDSIEELRRDLARLVKHYGR